MDQIALKSRKIAEAEIVVSVYRDGTIEVIKDRHDTTGTISLAALLHRLLPYQPEYLHSVITGWIEKLKLYNLFS